MTRLSVEYLSSASGMFFLVIKSTGVALESIQNLAKLDTIDVGVDAAVDAAVEAGDLGLDFLCVCLYIVNPFKLA